MRSTQPLDLEHHRDLSGLLRTSFAQYRANLGAVLALSTSIVVSVDLIMGAGLNQITSSYQSHPSSSVGTIELLVSLLVLTPLINATHAQVVLDLGRAKAPNAWRALQRGLDVFAPVLLVVILYVVAVFAGMILIVPGIYLAVSWYFAIQCVVIENLRGLAALRRSAELLRGNWWRVFGALAVITLIGLAPGLVLGFAVEALAKAANAQAVSLVGNMVIQTFTLPYVALSATLLFFDLRATSISPPSGISQ